MHSDHDSSSGRTSAAHSPRQPTATWNPARDAWEAQTTGLFCEHSDVFSETFSELGYDTWWTSLRAADVGAAHGRFRVFLFATPADAEHDGSPWATLARGTGAATAPGQHRHPSEPVGEPAGGHPPAEARPAEHADRGGRGAQWLPGVGRQVGAGRDDSRDAAAATDAGAHVPGGQLTLLPTPTSSDYKGSTTTRRQPGQDRGQLDAVTEGGHRWGDYAPAIARWEHTIGRPAPAPTEPGKNGNPRLSPAFVEWLMGLPAGHVTDPAIGLTRNEALKCLGNGVVPAQAAAAARAFIHDITQESAA